MYSADNEHDLVFDTYLSKWVYASHAEIERDNFRFKYEGQTFTSRKTGKKWKYVRKGNALGVIPA